MSSVQHHSHNRNTVYIQVTSLNKKERQSKISVVCRNVIVIILFLSLIITSVQFYHLRIHFSLPWPSCNRGRLNLLSLHCEHQPFRAITQEQAENWWMHQTQKSHFQIHQQLLCRCSLWLIWSVHRLHKIVQKNTVPEWSHPDTSRR